MGLDMYALVAENLEDEECEEIFYWRKHYALHDWMKTLWEIENPNSNEDFNCIKLQLSEEDLTQLRDDIINCTLSEYVGDEYINSGQQKEDIAFVMRALSEIDNGKIIYYDSWW